MAFENTDRNAVAKMTKDYTKTNKPKKLSFVETLFLGSSQSSKM